MQELIPKYIVLLGDAGAGKSAIVEKLTGEHGISSDSDQNFTTKTECFVVPDGSLVICDTPGSSSVADTFKDQSWFIEAMTYLPVWKILVTVKADTRIENVIKAVNEYSEHFLDMDEDVLGVLVTHMDQVEWTPEACTKEISEQLGIVDVVFSSRSSSSVALLRDVHGICKATHTVQVAELEQETKEDEGAKMTEEMETLRRQVSELSMEQSLATEERTRMTEDMDELRRGIEESLKCPVCLDIAKPPTQVLNYVFCYSHTSLTPSDLAVFRRPHRVLCLRRSPTVGKVPRLSDSPSWQALQKPPP